MDTNQDLRGKTPAHYALVLSRPMLQTAKDSYQAAESALLAVMEGQARLAASVILTDGVDALTDDDIAAVLAYFLLRGGDNFFGEARSPLGGKLLITAGEALHGHRKWMTTNPWGPVLVADMSRVWTGESKPVDVDPVLEDILLALSRHWNDEPMMLITKSPKESWNLIPERGGEDGWRVMPLLGTLAKGYGPFDAQNLQDALEGIRDERGAGLI